METCPKLKWAGAKKPKLLFSPIMLSREPEHPDAGNFFTSKTVRFPSLVNSLFFLPSCIAMHSIGK
jgi:hypothetical protein